MASYELIPADDRLWDVNGRSLTAHLVVRTDVSPKVVYVRVPDQAVASKILAALTAYDGA